MPRRRHGWRSTPKPRRVSRPSCGLRPHAPQAQAVLDDPNASDADKAKAQETVEVTTEFVAGMVATGRTLVQIISEPTKPMSKLVTLHNIMEHTEGPPNEPWLAVYEKTAAEIDGYIEEINEALE